MWGVWGWGGCAGFLFSWLGLVLFCFQAVPQVEGKHRLHSPLFLGGAVMELTCACLLVCLFAAQSSGQPRVVLL